MSVIPEFQKRKLQSPRSNFSLYFSRMTDWQFVRDEVKSKDGSIIDLGIAGNRLLSNAKMCLASIHRRQEHLLQLAKANGQFVLEIRAQLKTPFVSGLGSGHPTETGMILDRNTGVPYIPASSIKGILRLAHAVNLLNDSTLDSKWIEKGRVNKKGDFKRDPNGDQVNINDREPSLRRYFGDTDTKAKDCLRGQLVFLDAYPEQVPALKPDIMNPHYHKYYGASTPQEKERGPVDCDDPIPVKFLTISEGTVFIFRILFSPLPPLANELVEKSCFRQTDLKDLECIFGDFSEQDQEAVRNMFETAFSLLGFGSKTAIGYGRFTMVEEGNDTEIGASSTLVTTTENVWESANLSWAPNTGSLSVEYEGKKAQSKDKNLVPEKYHTSLFKRKKVVKVKVTVQATGNLFEILKID
ncbi:MAG: type III-B CRISPR module RAMP protein Cmr6 [Desulfovibrionales bacterium]|nr:type III-B CRISPR module RAMP protein Cmr6 [Desulfovibrionales bacterium]